jgi:hypothetical protein
VVEPVVASATSADGGIDPGQGARDELAGSFALGTPRLTTSG